MGWILLAAVIAAVAIGAGLVALGLGLVTAAGERPVE